MHRARNASAVLLIVLATGLAAGCGGDDETDPTLAWADSACGALAEWQTSLEDAVASVTDSPSRDSLEAAAQEVVDSTGALRDELTELGAPPTDAQEQTESALETLTTSLADRAEAVQEAVSSAGSLSELAAAVTAVATQVQGAVEDVQTFLEDAAEPGSGASEVQTALEQSDACTALRG